MKNCRATMLVLNLLLAVAVSGCKGCLSPKKKVPPGKVSVVGTWPNNFDTGTRSFEIIRATNFTFGGPFRGYHCSWQLWKDGSLVATFGGLGTTGLTFDDLSKEDFPALQLVMCLNDGSSRGKDIKCTIFERADDSAGPYNSGSSHIGYANLQEFLGDDLLKASGMSKHQWWLTEPVVGPMDDDHAVWAMAWSAGDTPPGATKTAEEFLKQPTAKWGLILRIRFVPKP